MFDELVLNLKIPPNVIKLKKYVTDRLRLPESGRTTSVYWLRRGWSEAEAKFRGSEEHKIALFKKPKKYSPFSKQFWLGKKNPLTGANYTEQEAIYQQNVRRPIRKEYWMKGGHDENASIILASTTKEKNNRKGALNSSNIGETVRKSFSWRCKEYWLLRGCSEEEAKMAIGRKQATFSLKKCIEKYGEEEGHKRWLDRQMKWHKSFKKSNFSKISQELFWKIAERLYTLENVFFAQLSKQKTKDVSGCNNEYRLRLDTMVLPDFIDVSKRRIIEFDGTYWHGRVGHGNKKRDGDRDKMLFDSGYSVLRVLEKEYQNDPNKVINECLNFLTQ